MSGTFCLPSPHTQFPAPSGCFHVCPGSTGSTPPSLPWPLSPPFTSSFMRLGPVLLCISRDLAFLRSVFHRYLVTLSVKSSLGTVPFQTLKYSVYVSFHTSCPFSLCPGIGTRQAIYFLLRPQVLLYSFLLHVWFLSSALCLFFLCRALAKLPCLNQMSLVPATVSLSAVSLPVLTLFTYTFS